MQAAHQAPAGDDLPVHRVKGVEGPPAADIYIYIYT